MKTSDMSMGAWAMALAAAASAGCAIDDRYVQTASENNEPGGSAGAMNSPGGSASQIAGPTANETFGGSGSGGSSGGEPPAVVATAGAPAAVGGMGGVDNAAGGSAGGAGGAASPDCAAGEPGCAGGVGVVITALDGWVDGGTNGVGIQGSFFVASDLQNGGGSTVQPDTFAASGADICVSGTVGQIQSTPSGDFDFATYWGMSVGLSLSQSSEAATSEPWSRSTPSGDAVGFTFTLRGSTVPFGAPLRFHALDSAGASYCVEVGATPGEPFTVLLAELTQECWAPQGLALPSDAPLTTLQWVVNSNTAASTPFDFCISELRVLVD